MNPADEVEGREGWHRSIVRNPAGGGVVAVWRPSSSDDPRAEGCRLWGDVLVRAALTTDGQETER